MKEKLAVNYGIHIWVFDKHFCKKKKKGYREPVTSKETTNTLNKFQAFQAKIRISENFICHHELGFLPILKDFSGETGGDINECDILILYNKMS